jgi:hypothetical protein
VLKLNTWPVYSAQKTEHLCSFGYFPVARSRYHLVWAIELLYFAGHMFAAMFRSAVRASPSGRHDARLKQDGFRRAVGSPYSSWLMTFMVPVS